MIPVTGQRFGPYEILGRLGGGGMGLVFRAWDERLHREVAIKLLHDDFKMPGMRERFLQEARAASALNHPNICTIFDIGEQGGDPYLVMELLEGETLKDRIARGALPAEEIIRYTEEITEALTVAHAKGIVHRDIKPANIFLVAMANGRSQAKVLDFGLAKIELEVRGGWESRTLDLTLAGSTVGTLAYMSPEQARGEYLDMRTDLFSLGVVMYEMATRQVPFSGMTSALMFVQLFTHTPEPVRNWNETIPRELERVVFRLLAKQPKDRFQTAKDLSDALASLSRKPVRTGWLHRRAAPPVPLVRAVDPVARHRGKRQRPDRFAGDSSGEVMPLIGAAAVESSTEILIRPRRTSSPDEPSVERPMGALSAINAELPTGLRRAHGIAAQTDSSAAAADVRAAQRAERDALAARSIREKEAVAAPYSDAGQFVHGFNDIELQGLGKTTGGRSVIVDPAANELTLNAVESRRLSDRMRLAVAVALVGLIVISVVLLQRKGFFRPVVLAPNERMLMTMIENKTGDKTLDGTVMQGLEIALGQSQSLNMMSSDAYRAGLREIEAEHSGESASGQKVAQRVGAKAYLYGEIRGDQPPYTINVDVLNTDSNDKLATLEETAETRAEIPEAIGNLAQAVRNEVSNDSPAGTKRSIAMAQYATANVDALHAFAMGEDAVLRGRPQDALADYQTATSLDPKFLQAQMRLAWLYRSEKAEVAATHAAELAQSAPAQASDKMKLLSQFCYELIATGDYGKATQTIREFVARYPRDVEGMKGLARVLRLQGHPAEALLAAQQGYNEDPYDAETYAEAEIAMITMNRYDSALQLDAQARRLGVLPAGLTLTAGYLNGREDIVTEETNALRVGISGESSAGDGQLSYADLDNYGLYLDATGEMDAGLELWITAADSAARMPELASAQAYLLAQGALDRALTDSCTVALKMVNDLRDLPKGPVASVNAGIAAALCGDQTYAEKTVAELLRDFPRNTAVAQYYVPELEAAASIGVNEPERALPGLISVRQYDQISLASYLRGLAHVAMGQMPLAADDFQDVLARRGTDAMLGGTLYPMAQMRAARAYATSADKAFHHRSSVDGKIRAIRDIHW
ncbi:serine/threonine-protein kinase [Granulicella sp. L60]|uniref:serine/threonine-protein kinase n=1 Tax=Granulicella sp. L60 TaxID=1641866 RepID=UPI00131E4B86|nr:serine/threonine-protein kinase [Granulicella sp. L60]